MDERIEVKSEQMRRIVGKVPSWLTRYGIFGLAVVTLGLLLMAYLLKFPSAARFEGKVAGREEIQLCTCERRHLALLKEGASFALSAGGETILRGRLGKVERIVFENDTFRINIRCALPLPAEQGGIVYLYRPGDNLSVEVYGSEVRLLDLLF